MWYAFCRLITQIVFLLFFGVRVYGQRHVPKTGGVILASTHQSFLDPMVVELGLPREGHIMARNTLFHNRLFGRLITSLGAFPVERYTADLTAVRHGVELLQAGEMLLLFPEGTRTVTGEIGSLLSGLSLMAWHSNAVIVPVAIDGAFECWPKGQGLPRPGRIRVMFGEPMRVTSRKAGDRKEFIAALRARMIEQQAELRRMGRGTG